MKPERLSNPKHPAQKPVNILRKMIRIASNKDDIVFDPFMGVGSIGVAAMAEGGSEINKEYFKAAKTRINNELNNSINMFEDQNCDMAEEPLPLYRNSLEWNLTYLKDLENNNAQKETKIINLGIPLEPIIKWPGGKEKELKFIFQNRPTYIKNYYEPFVGGGSVFMAFQAEHYHINDKSEELTSLYHSIAKHNDIFFDYANAIDESWANAKLFFDKNQILLNLYKQYRKNDIDKKTLSDSIKTFVKNKTKEINDIIIQPFDVNHNVLLGEMEKNITRKMLRMKVLEQQKHLLPEEDLCDNIGTAIKSALYMYYRFLYNDISLKKNKPEMHTALFFFIRNYAYSAMFRYNNNGDFNIPYGGIAYNGKSMGKKLEYYRSKELLMHFKNTTIYNLDFEDFLNKTKPQQDDFIFLDPPYDTEFSTYAKNVFSHDDQNRLAKWLIKECKAKWMLIIKNTDFILNLYAGQKGINIRAFDKKYTVSFMNRNNKKTEHLIITNY